MFVINTITKKILEKIIRENLKALGSDISCTLNECIKNLGFYYSTASGFSISIEDLKTPKQKEDLVEFIAQDFEKVSKNWSLGKVSDVERFQSVMDNWTIGAESLKNKIITYFEENDPLNILYIMAFSGARGNISQVRQVIGIRGLMVDQSGNIIDLPIKTNFREGLSSIDYIVSSYGARKGVVDTALKTADAGYLTRRLVYVAQDIVIKKMDCGTKNGLSFFLTKDADINQLIGRTLLKTINDKSEEKDYQRDNLILSESILTEFSKQAQEAPFHLYFRSPLTCENGTGICQKCYGWDLAERKIVELGTAVGIIAAQSIGEPGTQLTMRTFHTGGIFTGQFIEQKTSPCSGKLILPDILKSVLTRSSHGELLPYLLEDLEATIIQFDGKEIKFHIPRESFLHFQKSSFVKLGQLIAEYKKESRIFNERKIHSMLSPLDAEIENTQVFANILLDFKTNITTNNSVLYLRSGSFYETGFGSKLITTKYLHPRKAFAQLKLTTPIKGLVQLLNDEKKILIQTKCKRIELELEHFFSETLEMKLQLIVKNYHYVDSNTVLAFFYYYPCVSEKIYCIRKRQEQRQNEFFFVTENDIWKTDSDSPYQISNNKIISSGDFLTPSLKIENSGILLKKDGFRKIYQKVLAIFFPQGSLLYTLPGQFVKKNQLLGKFIFSSKQKNEDIVQGLPKIEEVFEARRLGNSAKLAYTPGLFLGYWQTKLQIPKKNLIDEKLLSKIYHLSLIPRNLVEFDSKLRKTLINKSDPRSMRSLTRKHYKVVSLLPRIRSKKPILFSQGNFYNVISLLPRKSFLAKAYFLKEPIKCELFSDSASKTIFINKIIYGVHHEVFESKVPILDYRKSLYSSKFQDSKFLLDDSSNLDDLTYYSPDLPDLGWFKLKICETTLHSSLLKEKALKSNISEFIEVGQPITYGVMDSHNLLKVLFSYHCELDGITKGSYRSVIKIQLILLNSIQSIYISQGVNIANLHIELILKQMTSKARLLTRKKTNFFPQELVSFNLMHEAAKIFEELNIIPPFYEPILMPITKTVLQKEGFLAAAGFQETRAVLARAAIEGKRDWLQGLKECVIIGKLVPAGTAFLNYKHFLDNIVYYKRIKKVDL